MGKSKFRVPLWVFARALLLLIAVTWAPAAWSQATTYFYTGATLQLAGFSPPADIGGALDFCSNCSITGSVTLDRPLKPNEHVIGLFNSPTLPSGAYVHVLSYSFSAAQSLTIDNNDILVGNPGLFQFQTDAQGAIQYGCVSIAGASGIHIGEGININLDAFCMSNNGDTLDYVDVIDQIGAYVRNYEYYASIPGTWRSTNVVNDFCDTSASINVTLPTVTVNPAIIIKPWRISYAELSLNFAVTKSANSCDAQSNSGNLGVYFSNPLSGSNGIQIADSITTAQLSVFQSGVVGPVESCQFTLFNSVTDNCLLNGAYTSSGSYARWSSPGFTTVPFPAYQNAIPGPGTGPLTFWVDLDALGISPTANSISRIVSAAEPYIHRTLISNLPYLAHYTVIQDPGNVSILVVNQDGLTAGTAPGSIRTLDIPRSFSYPSTTNPAVILQNPVDGRYQVRLTGLHSGPYELSASATSFNNESSQQVVDGTISQGTTIAYQLDLTTSNVGQTQDLAVAKLIPGDLNGDGQVDCGDLTVVKASFGKKTGQVGFNAWADVNGDGVVNVPDLVAIFRRLDHPASCQLGQFVK
jgi:hypothetical protein